MDPNDLSHLAQNATGDVVVVGAGISGLLTALFLADYCPKTNVTVIDTVSLPVHMPMFLSYYHCITDNIGT